MNDQIIINIHQLGAIRNAKITLNQFMIFSGASGLGKSYAAMLVHFVYRVLTGEELEGFFRLRNASLSDLKRFDDVAKHEVYSCPSDDFIQWINTRAQEYMKELLSFEDLNMDVSIEFNGLPQILRFYYNHTERINHKDEPNIEARGALSMNKSLFGGVSFPLSIVPQIQLDLFSTVLSGYLTDKFKIGFVGSTFFMPPSRGAVLQVPLDKQFKVFESTPMYAEFIEKFANIRSYSPYTQKPIRTTRITDGRLEEKEGKLIYMTHDTPLPISAAASSIKEIAPFIIMAEKGFARYYSILFEEPESHLHPEMQNAVVDVMAQMIEQGSHFQITTHSDYVLRRINDLIYLHLLKEKWADAGKFSAFCEKYGLNENIAINPSLINAYFFKAEEGGLSSVIEQDLSDGVPFDTFEKMINKNFPISTKIYEQFEELRS